MTVEWSNKHCSVLNQENTAFSVSDFILLSGVYFYGFIFSLRICLPVEPDDRRTWCTGCVNHDTLVVVMTMMIIIMIMGSKIGRDWLILQPTTLNRRVYKTSSQTYAECDILGLCRVWYVRDLAFWWTLHFTFKNWVPCIICLQTLLRKKKQLPK